jgi:hypothetical protein
VGFGIGLAGGIIAGSQPCEKGTCSTQGAAYVGYPVLGAALGAVFGLLVSLTP